MSYLRRPQVGDVVSFYDGNDYIDNPFEDYYFVTQVRDRDILMYEVKRLPILPAVSKYRFTKPIKSFGLYQARLNKNGDYKMGHSCNGDYRVEYKIHPSGTFELCEDETGDWNYSSASDSE